TTLFSSSHRYKIHHQNYGLAVFFLRLHLIAVFHYAFAFGSSLSSTTLSPLGHRCLRLRLLLCVIVVFVSSTVLVSSAVLDPAIKERQGLATQKR
ncbi:Uncharacterized protein APZ42_003419, partial [Daphnia magna]